MATEQICPVTSSATTVLPPGHPSYDPDSSKTCPITGASTEHHHILHPHPSAAGVDTDSMDAQACPAIKSISKKEENLDSVCPVVGPVNAHLPANHPPVGDASDSAVCPVTKATKGHHEGKVAEHPKLTEGVCPISHKTADGKTVV